MWPVGIGQMFQTLFCFALGVLALAGGSAVWLMIRGRPVTPATVGMMIGGMVKWMIVDMLINMVFATVFNSARRRW